MCLVKIRNNQTPKGNERSVASGPVQHLGRNLEAGCDLRLTGRGTSGENGENDTAASIPHFGHTGTTRRSGRQLGLHNHRVRVSARNVRRGRPQPGSRARSTVVDRIGTVHARPARRRPPLSMSTPGHHRAIHSDGVISSACPQGCPHPSGRSCTGRTQALRSRYRPHRSRSGRQRADERRSAIPKQHTASSTAASAHRQTWCTAIMHPEQGATQVGSHPYSSSSAQIYPQGAHASSACA
ncbi:hypothetical protein NONI108955_23680 [Nocardia ninae]